MLKSIGLFPRALQVIGGKYSRLSAILAFGSLSTPVFGQLAVGLVGGVARDSTTGAPVEQVQIVAHNMATGANRAAVTGADGNFTITNLAPGVYEVAATKNGYQRSTTDVMVSASQKARVNVALKTAADLRIPKPDDAPLTAREKQLLDRIERLEQRLAAMEAKEGNPAQAEVANAPTAHPSDQLTASLPPAPPQPAEPEQTATPQQSGGKSGPIATPPTAVSPPEHRLPDALQAPDAPPAVDDETPFAFGDFTWLNGTSAQQRYRARYEVLHAGNPIRYALHGGFQSADRPHHRRGDRIVPLRRSPDRAGQRRRRLPLAECSRPNPVHGRLVCHHHAAQRRKLGHWLWHAEIPAESASGTFRVPTSTCRKPTAGITSTFNTG